MHPKKPSRSLIATAVICMATLAPQIGSATIVEVKTNFGDFQINLYDNATPQTVANFLSYVTNDDYDDSVIHRSELRFIIQGGASTVDANGLLTSVRPRPAVNNEPVYSNVRGTIAMAKFAGDPNSASSQWFFNLGNNAPNLDFQNGGFTVFGEVTTGMAVVDAIADLPTFDDISGFNGIPLQNYIALDPVVRDNFVIITEISVIDNTVDSAAGLNPTPTTASNGGGGGGGGGGGSFGLLALAGLLAVGRRRYRVAKTA